MHKSFVRSCEMDRWKLEHLKAMELGGNARAREFLRNHGFANHENAKESLKGDDVMLPLS